MFQLSQDAWKQTRCHGLPESRGFPETPVLPQTQVLLQAQALPQAQAALPEANGSQSMGRMKTSHIHNIWRLDSTQREKELAMADEANFFQRR